MAQVLIVDDHVDICRILARLVRMSGHEALCVPGGAEAIHFLNTSVPDLVILDIMMPGVDGLEVLRTVRTDERTVKVPVVIHSAIADPAVRRQAIHGGANDYWVKGSIEVSQFGNRLTRLLQNSSTTQLDA